MLWISPVFRSSLPSMFGISGCTSTVIYLWGLTSLPHVLSSPSSATCRAPESHNGLRSLAYQSTCSHLQKSLVDRVDSYCTAMIVFFPKIHQTSWQLGLCTRSWWGLTVILRPFAAVDEDGRGWGMKGRNGEGLYPKFCLGFQVLP